MTRQFWVLVHRYAGLYMAFFLTVAGMTGSVLAFYQELDGWLNPERHYVVPQDKPLLDGYTLREKALALEPHAQVNMISFNLKPGQVYEIFLSPRNDPETGKPYDLGHNLIRLNPYSGELIEYGKDEGLWPLSRRNILSVIYSLHYSLALGEVGGWLFGIAALIWTVDCFVGFYLTLPIRRNNSEVRLKQPLAQQQKGYWSRWVVAWKIKWPASNYRINFDLHRAGGLWTWIMLFVFAWSSVCFNLRTQVYQPVMVALFDLPDIGNLPIANLPQPRPEPGIDWHTAQTIGQRFMAEQAELQHFNIYAEDTLLYLPEKGLFAYGTKTDRDIGDKNGGTAVYFDGDSGKFVSLFMPSGQNAGITATLWLVTLHMAGIWGLPFQIFVCLMGLVVAMLSITGVYIWLKKRRARLFSQKRQMSIPHESKGLTP